MATGTRKKDNSEEENNRNNSIKGKKTAGTAAILPE